ncbi:MAG: S9 family peptidase [Alphaproteobacteria bacterium]|nr:S9 family peptidase [Alphaproteobacteria bacterium]
MRYTLACIVALFSTAALAAPPIEAYGELAEIRSFDISPDGSRFAFFRRQGDREIMVVFEAGAGVIGSLDVTEVKARRLDFISNKHVVVFASQTTKLGGGFEDNQGMSFNIETGEVLALMSKEKRYRFYAATAGGQLTPTDNPDEAFFTTWTAAKGEKARSTLVRGNLITGKASIVTKGSSSSIDWSVTRDGTVIAREDYDDSTNLYEIYTRKDGVWKRIYRERSELPKIGYVGYLPDRSGLLVWKNLSKYSVQTLHKLSFDGTLSEPLYNSENRNINAVYRDSWDQVIGFRYAGMKPSYFFFDQGINEAVNRVASSFPDDAVILSDWTDDYSQLVFFVSGAKTAPATFLLNRNTRAFGKLVPNYLRIADADIMPVDLTEYKARDGLVIPSLLTHPKGATKGSKLPLIIMPHGGPEAFSSLGFSYRAQYFASRGYLVLQPNFRGSAGFGTDHIDAGHGEWGGKMQDDLTDGVNHLVAEGWADPDRVCIIGASYGGYAALAGGAFTPDLYKCVAAIAPVTDVSAFLNDIAFDLGKNSSSISYWKDWLGDRQKDKEAMAAISPVNSAGNFKSPVLLMHGTDDTIVPYNQSIKMRDALLGARKDVRFVKLDKEDHWMSNNETRLQALKELDRFVRETIGPAR